jgi:hypothetical protein
VAKAKPSNPKIFYYSWSYLTKIYACAPVAHVGTNNWWQKNFWQVTTMQIESRYMNQPSEKTQWDEIIS